MAHNSLTREQILILLAEGPAHIAALVAGLTPVQLQSKPKPGAWSATAVLAHLRSCADVWGDCIAMILAQEQPTIRAINPMTWVERTDYATLDFQASFDAFTAQRTALLARLEPLPAAVWARSATVTGAGRPLERTLHFYAQWLASPHIDPQRSVGRIGDALFSQPRPGDDSGFCLVVRPDRG